MVATEDTYMVGRDAGAGVGYLAGRLRAGLSSSAHSIAVYKTTKH